MADRAGVRGHFSWLMAFGQAEFQATNATIYLQTASLQWFIHSRTPVGGILADQQALGAHSSIVLFHPDGAVLCYRWAHPYLAPFGSPSTAQCECGSIRPWKTPVGVFQPANGEEGTPYVELICGFCKVKLTYTQGEGRKKMGGGGMSEEVSCGWYFEYIAADGELEL